MQWKVCRSSNKLASDAVRWQEDKYALQQQQQVLTSKKADDSNHRLFIKRPETDSFVFFFSSFLFLEYDFRPIGVTFFFSAHSR